MATLHVRNVPEPVYELLRECAEQEGRSIGAQAIVLIQQSLFPRQMQRRGLRTRGGLQRFTPRARDAVVRAKEEARAGGAAEVLPGHILLGLLDVEGPAQHALGELGVDAASVRERLPTGSGSPRRLPFGPEAKAVLEHALRESLALRHGSIGGEHLLLALTDDELLAGLDVRAAVTLAMSRTTFELRPWESPAQADAPEYLALDLDGAAEAWTEQLNELAADGWELMQVVEGRRAVLRRP